MRAIRIISGILALGQLAWAAALVAAPGAPRWALVVGAVLAAIGTAGPGILKGMVESDPAAGPTVKS
jgi:hypothetical protein